MGVRVKRPQSSDAAKRQKPTFAESAAWEILRTLKAPGLHFRRQGKAGPFSVDFVCRRARIVIEVDGGIHRIEHAEDAQRQQLIEAMGYRVLRFDNEIVIKAPERVRTQIITALVEAGFSPPLNPLPAKGEGRCARLLNMAGE